MILGTAGDDGEHGQLHLGAVVPAVDDGVGRAPARQVVRVRGPRGREGVARGPGRSALAADGLSNREVAQALFVTAKTVETHLGHVYRKLAVTGHDELLDALRERNCGLQPTISLT